MTVTQREQDEETLDEAYTNVFRELRTRLDAAEAENVRLRGLLVRGSDAQYWMSRAGDAEQEVHRLREALGAIPCKFITPCNAADLPPEARARRAEWGDICPQCAALTGAPAALQPHAEQGS